MQFNTVNGTSKLQVYMKLLVTNTQAFSVEVTTVVNLKPLLMKSYNICIKQSHLRAVVNTEQCMILLFLTPFRIASISAHSVVNPLLQKEV